MWIIALVAIAQPTVAAENGLNVSWGDHIVVYDGIGKLDTEEKIAAAMDDWKRLADSPTIYWRASAWYARNYMVPLHDSFPEYFDTVERIWAEFDPMAVAIREAHERGMKIYAYQTLFDEGSPAEVLYGDSKPFPWQSKFTIAHPEYLATDREGMKRHHGVMEYAYPQVRAHMLAMLSRLVDDYDFDGLYICTRSHSRPADHADQFGFGEPVALAYEEAYGVDPRAEDFDVAKWRDLRGEFLTGFLRELRAAMDEREKRIALAIPRGDIIGPPYGNMTMDWRTWVRENLADEIIVGVRSGNWHYPSMRGKDKERGYLSSNDEQWGLPGAREHIDTVYGPLCDEHGVGLLIQGGSWGRGAKDRVANTPLDGFMFSSMSLTSGSGYIVVPDDPALGFADARFTVDCWLRYPEEVTFGRVVSKYDHNLGHEGRGWEIYIDKEAHVVWRLNDGENDMSITSEGTVPAQEWVHLACVSEGAGGQMRVYINGIEDAQTRPAPAALRLVPVDLFIGAYGGEGVFLNAQIDEVRLSSIARTFTEPLTGPTPVDDDTVALWSFEDESDEVTSEGATFTGTVMRAQPHERIDGPAGFGKAIDLSRRH